MSNVFDLASAILDAYNKNALSGVVVFGAIRTGSEILLNNADVRHLLTPVMAARASVYTTPVYIPINVMIGRRAVQLMSHLSQFEEGTLEPDFFLIRSAGDHTVVPHTFVTTVGYKEESFAVYFRVYIDGWDFLRNSEGKFGVMDIHPLLSHRSLQSKPQLKAKLEDAIRVVFGSKE
jgi:hypothetical protein